MTAADKIQAARALIEPLTGHDKGPWFAYGRYIGTTNHKSSIGECRDENGNWSDTARSSGNARILAAAPALRDTVAALADLADALAQENANLRSALEDVTSDLFYQIEAKHGPKAASRYPCIVRARAALTPDTEAGQ